MDWIQKLDAITLQPYWFKPSTGETTYVNPFGIQGDDRPGYTANPNSTPTRPAAPFVPQIPNDPRDDPTSPEFYTSLGKTPPWINDGYGSYAAWSAAKTGDTNRGQTISVGGNTKLIDPRTGAVIVDYGPSAAPASGDSAATRDQQQRQFQKTFDFEKAKFNQGAVADAAKLKQENDQFLAKLGTDPKTLVRYLFALQGQQAPNGIGGPSSSPAAGAAVSSPPLPPPGTAPGNGSTSPTGIVAPFPGAKYFSQDSVGGVSGWSDPTTGKVRFFKGGAEIGGAPPLGVPSIAAPAAGAPPPNGFAPLPAGALAPGVNPFASLQPAPSTQGAGNPNSPAATAQGSGAYGPIDPAILSATNAQRAAMTPADRAFDANFADQQEARRGYAQGGIIPEKVVGVGQDSGQTYEFGEEGTEAVVSNDMLERLMQVAGKVDFHKKGKDGGMQRFSFTLNGPPKLGKSSGGMNSYARGGEIGNDPMPSGPHMMPNGQMMDGGEQGSSENSYATGGTIGYDPSRVPTLGSQSAGLFNDPNLQNVVQRGYNRSPNIPLFPQVGIATGGGSSLIPSAQRLNSLLPSEQDVYGDTLQTEFGVQPNDVFALSRKLAPQVSGLRTPSFTN